MPIPAARTAVPAFYLYGEPQRIVTEGFVHVESLDDRSRPSEWTIQPHIHRDLNHLILIAEGGGTMLAEIEQVSFAAPCLLLIPAGIVHGFTWHQESSGWVTTVADSYLRHLLEHDPDLASLFRGPRVVPLSSDDRHMIEQAVEQMGRELSWAGRGQRAAVAALLLNVMVRALRRTADTADAGRDHGRQATLVARLRARIEQRFREREPVAAFASALGVSETALRQASARVAGRSPAAMLDERTLLEARRLLLYSNLTVAEVGYAVGFDDPAYFSRFFSRHVGEPPRTYRARKQDGGHPPA